MTIEKLKQDDTNTLGVSVGSVGRFIRLWLGVCVLIWVGVDFYPVTHSHNLDFFLMMAGSFLALTVSFTLLHILIGSYLVGKNPIYGTLIFVLPMIYLLVAPELDHSQQFGHWFGWPELNHPFRIGLLLFLGVSLIVQFFDKYGGCEVVAIPNVLFRKNYGTYCLPLLVIDALENNKSKE
ncbi:hypothetical protein [Aliikangiella sp. IMCC44359]|uniref:hypothetical protein n=1 Tax=Aliikangiella sp. IMCC44359 TaxID=3459125 RepID=UPI00403B14AD